MVLMKITIRPWLGRVHKLKHGSLQPGILRDKTVEDKFLYIANYHKQNYPSCRLEFLMGNFTSCKCILPKQDMR